VCVFWPEERHAPVDRARCRSRSRGGRKHDDQRFFPTPPPTATPPTATPPTTCEDKVTTRVSARETQATRS
jgi:hypothetical protein